MSSILFLSSLPSPIPLLGVESKQLSSVFLSPLAWFSFTPMAITVNGTENNDTLNGTNSADTLNGLGGDDILKWS